ncbi:MAG: hypothetical protein ABUT20_06975 [Bacteroidota bacterium]
MEVHHHSHSERKKWTHYFWEFLMLFLAVTLGFFVENQREHIVEKKREKQYIRSMIEDLRLDTAVFTLDNRTRQEAVAMYDSVIMLLNKKNRSEFDQQRLYYLARMGLRLSPFPRVNDRTYEQMKSSGNLRLIHDSKTADRVTKYYFNAKEIVVNEDQTLLRLQSLIEIHGKVFDGSVFREMLELKKFAINPPTGNPELITENKETLNELSVRIHYVLSILLYSYNYTVDLINEAAQLIDVLKNEYHLK